MSQALQTRRAAAPLLPKPPQKRASFAAGVKCEAADSQLLRGSARGRRRLARRTHSWSVGWRAFAQAEAEEVSELCAALRIQARELEAQASQMRAEKSKLFAASCNASAICGAGWYRRLWWHPGLDLSFQA